ncbi:MAG: acyltransferase [Alteromonadaceae bacterium]|nr:acyltransferase [Alteromonadaceae bacterium]
MRLEVFDKFRAIAIILIILDHSIQPWGNHPYYEKIFITLVSGGSNLFVFISGFFFHHVFFNDFNYKKFMLHKFKRVFIAYLVLSVLCLMFLPFIQDGLFWERVFGEADTLSEQAILYGKVFLYGKAQAPYWYIPFISIMFLLSPVFIKILKLPMKLLIGVFVLLLVIAMTAYKPWHQMNPLHSVVYYSHLYILGAIFSLNKDKLLHYFDNKLSILAAGILLLSLAQLYFYEKFRVLAKSNFFEFQGFDLLVVQKVLVCFFIIGLLNKLHFIKDKTGIFADITKASFSLYFLHFFVIQIVNQYIDSGPSPGILIIFLKTAFIVLTTLALAKMIKRLIGSKSKYVIGW